MPLYQPMEPPALRQDLAYFLLDLEELAERVGVFK
jgi:hypothetical protein